MSAMKRAMRLARWAMRDGLATSLAASFAIVVTSASATPLGAQAPRNLLVGGTSEAQLAAMLVPRVVLGEQHFIVGYAP